MKDNQNDEAQLGADRSANGGLTDDVKAKACHVADAIASMDHRVSLELARLEQSAAEADLKEFIRQDILSRHNTRREAHTAILEKLQGQQSRRTAAA